MSLSLWLLGFVFGLLLGLGIHAVRVRRQARKLAAVAHAIARGNRRVRAGFRRGPLADLARFFDAMLSQVERELKELLDSQAELEQLVATDRLTGVGNRRAFDSLAELEVARARRYGIPVSVILFDIDHFKRVNDEFGHSIGDMVLVSLARRVASRLRDTDSISRWGGEEFAIITPCTPIPGAEVLAEAVRRCVAEEPFETVGQVTISLGAAELLPRETASEWVARADRLLYLAKRQGRNRLSATTNVAERSVPFILAWGEPFLTGLPSVDAEHEELFRLANALVLLAPDSAPEKTLDCVDALLEHMLRHFASEEATLSQLGCNNVEAHASLHRGLAAQARAMRHRFAAGEVRADDVSDFVVRRVTVGHLVAHDLPLFARLAPPSQQTYWSGSHAVSQAPTEPPAASETLPNSKAPRLARSVGVE